MQTERSSAGNVSCGRNYPPRFEFSTRHWCLHFPRFISEFNRCCSLSGSDEPVDSEMSVVTSSTSRICRFSLPDVLIEIELRTCIHRGKYACVCEHLRLYFIL